MLAFTKSSIRRSGPFGLPLGMSTTANGGDDGSSAGPPSMLNFRNSLDNSWIDQLSPKEPHNLERSLKRAHGGTGRPVFNGHYVRVRPTPLTNPIVAARQWSSYQKAGEKVCDIVL